MRPIVPSLRRLPARLADRLVAGDPARSRLRLAARALFAVILTAGALFGTAQFHLVPPAAFGLGLLLSFIGTIGVREPGWRRQTVTRSAAALVGAVSTVLAGALSAWPVAADLTFLAVIFVSVYIRRYGMRWLALGLVAFMAYFMGDYMRPAPSQAGWMLAAAAVALASAQVASVLLLPDDPERDFRRAMSTIDHRINLILDHLLRAAEAGHPPPDAQERIREQMTQFREIVLMAEGFLPQITAKGMALNSAGAELAAALVDLMLAVERLVRFRQTALPTPEALLALMNERGPMVRRNTAHTGPRAGAMHLLDELRRARARVNAALGPAPSAAFAGGAGPAPAAQQVALGPDRAGVPAAFHRPIQVTLACGAALAIGLALSPTRWYWAVITAYIVFNNTRTRADAVARALSRSAGTVAGVLAGTLFATLLQGHPLASGLLLPVLFFLAVYNLQTSYAWMICHFTIALALLYGLMGMFTPELLLLRLVETLVGGLCGATAAVLVFPVRAGGQVDVALVAFLDALGAVIGAASARARAEVSDLTSATLGLERTYGALAAAVRPLGGPWAAVTRFGAVRAGLLLMVSCAHWARVLARAVEADQAMSPAERDRAAELTARVQDKLALLRASAAGWFATGLTDEPLAAPVPAPSAGELRWEAAIGALEAIDALLERALHKVHRA